MKKYISILFIFLYSFALTQDVYPNFSDPKNQLRFERKRIYIKEVSEKEMILGGGGSQFNPLALFNDMFPDYIQQPTYTQSNLTTQYRYKYIFEVSQNNKLLNEVDFLYEVGLNDEADDIIAAYKIELQKYSEQLSSYNKDLGTNIEELKKKRKNMTKFTLVTAITSLIIGQIVWSVVEQNDAGEISGLPMAINAISLTIFIGTIPYWFWNANKYNKEIQSEKHLNKPQVPPFKQTLSSSQLTAIAESYNRQVYKQIQSSY